MTIKVMSGSKMQALEMLAALLTCPQALNVRFPDGP